MKDFDGIVSTHGMQNNFLPLWKIVNVMDQSDVDELNLYIDHCMSLGLKKSKLVESIAKEVVLLCAYWWQRTYASGIPSIDDILTDNNRTAQQERRLWLDAIKDCLSVYAAGWNINLVKNINTLWFYSALSLGGVPTVLLAANNARWSTFLQTLLDYYDIPIRPTYRQLYEFAKKNASAFGHANETVSLFCSELIVDLVSGNNNFSAYPKLSTLYSSLATSHNNKHRNSTSFDEFRVYWEFLDNGAQWEMCYTINCPKDYPSCLGDTYNAIILNGEQTIAEYYEHNGTMVLNKSLQKEIIHKPFGKYDIIIMDKRNQLNVDVPCPLLNADSPSLAESPILLYQDGNYWTEKRDLSKPMGILCPSGWRCELTPSKIVTIDNSNYDFYDINWSNLPTRQVCFIDHLDQAHTVKQPTIQDSSYSRLFDEFEWIADNPGTIVVINVANYNRCICVMNHTTHCSVPRNQYDIEYKTSNTSYKKYSNGPLPDGYVWIRIVMPDNTTRSFKIFCINDSRGSILDANSISNNQFVWQNGTITPTGNTSAESTKYRFMAQNGDYIDIAIINNQPACCFFDLSGNQLANNARIAYRDIDEYRAYLLRNNNLQISMVYDSPKLPAIISPLCRKNLDPTNRAGRFSLSFYAKDWVEKCFWLYGFNDKTHHVVVKAGGNNTLNVYRYHYDAIVNGDTVYVNDGVNGISNLPLVGYALSPLNTISQYKFRDIQNQPGCYEPVQNLTYPIVVISQDPNRSIYPILLDPNAGGTASTNYSTQDMINEMEEHDQLRASSIMDWEQELRNGCAQAWNNLWFIWRICKDYNIDYARMNCFAAITNNPDLQIMFLNRINPLALGWTEEDVVDELYRMQFELGFAFFYLPTNTASWTLANPILKWIIPILNKDGLPFNVLSPTHPNNTQQPNMFIGEFPTDARNKIYNIGGMGCSANAQQQLQWAKCETPNFAYVAASGQQKIWTYTPNPQCLMPYNRWMMRLINYCVHYDMEDFKSRYI